MDSEGNKTGGRQKGTPNKRNLRIAELVEQHDADPVLMLIKVMKGDRRELGYEDRVTVRKREIDEQRADHEARAIEAAKKGKSIKPFLEPRELVEAEAIEINMFPADMRIDAAKELMPYLYGKRKPIDSTGDDTRDVLSDILDAIDGSK